jgi:hypothetical protein
MAFRVGVQVSVDHNYPGICRGVPAEESYCFGMGICRDGWVLLFFASSSTQDRV